MLLSQRKASVETAEVVAIADAAIAHHFFGRIILDVHRHPLQDFVDLRRQPCQDFVHLLVESLAIVRTHGAARFPPRSFTSSLPISAGIGVVKERSWPVIGCLKSSVMACRACRWAPLRSMLGVLKSGLL